PRSAGTIATTKRHKAGNRYCQATKRSLTSPAGGRGEPPRLESSRYIQASDMKGGNCQRKTMAKSPQAAGSRCPHAAVQPIKGGAAPGTAPTRVHRGVIRFSGVYKNK